MCKFTCKSYQIVCKQGIAKEEAGAGGRACNGKEGCELSALKCIQNGSCCLMRGVCNLCKFGGMGHPDKQTGKRLPGDQATSDDCKSALKCCKQASDKCGDCFQ
jgi:hypothetical protein